MLDILSTVEKWLSADDPVILARVTQTWGSAPRNEGSMMAFRPDLSMTGSVSGGCIEGAVIEEGLDAHKKGEGRWLNFGISDDTAWSVGLSCGGKVNVYVESLDRNWWQILQERINNNENTVTLTAIDGNLKGEKVIFDAEFQAVYATPALTDDIVQQWATVAQATQKSQEIVHEDSRLFVDVYSSQPHLIIVGGVHIAIPLQSIARTVGFRVSIIDPRSAFATEERFPEVDTILHSYPDKALQQLGMNSQTYLTVLTHDPKIDDKALITALPQNLPYIGVLSSKKTHEKRTARLKEAGISDELIAKIYTPIGLNIGSKTPEEIALSIMAEIVAVRNEVHERSS